LVLANGDGAAAEITVMLVSNHPIATGIALRCFPNFNSQFDISVLRLVPSRTPPRGALGAFVAATPAMPCHASQPASHDDVTDKRRICNIFLYTETLMASVPVVSQQ
jgi:hypothetical protein